MDNKSSHFKAKLFSQEGMDIYHALAKDFNEFFDKVDVLDINEKTKIAALAHLKSAFDMLGVSILEKHEA